MGRQSKTGYPEWAEIHRTQGTTIKKINGNLYLYKRVTSVRKEKGKNPSPVYEFLGTITENGLIPPKKQRIDTSAEVVVREYGFSNVLQRICPKSWKDVQGKNWDQKLSALTVYRSRNSYLLDVKEEVRTPQDLRMPIGATMSSLNRKISEEYSVNLDELQTLDTIYLVRMGGRSLLSRIEEGQQRILDRIGIRLEV